ncbi:hypothetical protein XENORESO_014116 [Xenotaenia resolanae]|uniref:FISNA domain-containing protein n=1 Tax=Xenotaenia resolanae TaxID=208358 RepID=A0ABV0VX74_9TELE
MDTQESPKHPMSSCMFDFVSSVDQQNSEVPSGPSAQQHQTQLDSIFMLLEDNMVSFVKNELKEIQKVLSLNFPECCDSQRDEMEVLEGEDEEQRKSSREAFEKITLNFLKKMKYEDLAERLKTNIYHNVRIYLDLLAASCQRKLKSGLKKSFQCVFEGIAKAGRPTLLNQIYTELYITEGRTGEVNDEHENSDDKGSGWHWENSLNPEVHSGLG